MDDKARDSAWKLKKSGVFPSVGGILGVTQTHFELKCHGKKFFVVSLSEERPIPKKLLMYIFVKFCFYDYQNGINSTQLRRRDGNQRQNYVHNFWGVLFCVAFLPNQSMQSYEIWGVGAEFDLLLRSNMKKKISHHEWCQNCQCFLWDTHGTHPVGVWT